MKFRLAARSAGLVLAVAWPALHALSATAPGVVEGTLTQVSTNHVQIDHDKSYEFDPVSASCFDFRGDAMTCATLVGIGYADRVRITLRGTVVQRIDILELQQ